MKVEDGGMWSEGAIYRVAERATIRKRDTLVFSHAGSCFRGGILEGWLMYISVRAKLKDLVMFQLGGYVGAKP